MIVGGGIAGLTTAIALKKVGIDCVVFEKATEDKEVPTFFCIILVVMNEKNK